jgi:hypothetical protein
VTSSDSIFDASPDALVGIDLDAALLDAAITHWHNCLFASPRLDAVLRDLGIDRTWARELRVGLSDRTLGTRIPKRQWKAGALIRERLNAIGVLRDSGHETFRGCVVVPVTNGGGVRALFALRQERPREVLWAKGLPGGIFSVAAKMPAAQGDDITVVTASIVDALAVLGTVKSASASVLLNANVTVVAPARPGGFSPRDVSALTTRAGELILLGRGHGELDAKLRRAGAQLTVAGPDVDLARAFATSTDGDAMLRSLLEHAEPHDSATRTELETTIVELARVSPDPDGSTELAVVASETSTEPLESFECSVTPGRDELFVRTTERSWRVRGAAHRSNVEGDRLSVALSVSDLATGRFHLDTLDLYAARARASFLDAAEQELGAPRTSLSLEMAHVLNAAERTRDEGATAAIDATPTLSDADRAEALAWLSEPNLLSRLTNDLAALGVVGEEHNLLLCYLAVLSRKSERPLGVLVQSSSAGGKSTLVDAVSSLVPEEDLVALSAITPQALYYVGGRGLAHKVLVVAEERGSSRASYALKLLLSEGRLAIAATGKDAASGRLATMNYVTTGTPALLMTTTASSIDPELENRLVVLGVNEDATQTAAVIAAQRRSATVDGLVARSAREELRRRHANVQRLLQALPVVLDEFDYDFPSSSTRHRRDHAKVLSIIAAVTLLHQFQREHHTATFGTEIVTYLVATADDIAVGLELAARVLARNADSLAPQTHRLLVALREFARIAADQRGCDVSDIHFTRREMRERLGWSDTQVRAGTDRLVALEYLVVSGGGRGRCRTYCLVGEIWSPRTALDEPVHPDIAPYREFAQFVSVGDEP